MNARVVMATICGTTGNDSLVVNSTTDIVQAGSGLDIVVFSGDYADYTYSQSDSLIPLVIHNATNQIVSLHGVEKMLFDDGLVDLLISGNGEFNVHAVSSLDQIDSSAAVLADGGFVVAWDSFGEDGDWWGVFVQRYDANGNILGVEFQVNVKINSNQFYSDVAALNDGGFVIVWESFGQDGDDYGVFGQRYDENGNAIDDEFKIKTTTLDWQNTVAVTGLKNGGFVATWDSFNPSTLDWDILAQRYDNNGNTLGVEFQISTTSINYQTYSSIAALENGGFVVTWESDQQDGFEQGVFRRIFDVSGVSLGAEFQVNTTTFSSQQNSAVVGLVDGRFIVTWDSYDAYYLDWDVFAQRYDADGNAFGANNNDTVNSNSWSNEIYGTDEANTLEGGITNDYIYTGDGIDFVYGNDGDDFIDAFTSNGSKTIYGGDGEDIIWGGESADFINGGAGNDEIYGFGGNDTLSGGAGFDWIFGGEGDDTYLVTDQWDYIWDYLGDNNVVVSADYYKPPSTVSEISYIDDAKPLPYWIDALTHDSLSATRYHIEATERQFYYMFPVSPLGYYDAVDLIGWRAANDSLKEAFEYVVSALEDIIDIVFVPTDNPLQLNTITLSSNTQLQSSAYAFAPDSLKDSNYYLSSDIFINTYFDQPSITEPNYDLEVLVHELGHALGLKHPFGETGAFGLIGEGPYLEYESEENTDWTDMSYTEGSGAYSAHFSPFDIAALQYIYGVAPGVNAGDNTYFFDGSKGVFIYDGQGIDVIDASNAQAQATIYLTEGDWSFIGEKLNLISSANQLTINFDTEIENVIGSDFDDMLFGNALNNKLQGGGGNDTLEGYSGNDLIIGNEGNDYLNGGEGQDTAIYDGQWQNYSVGLSDVLNTIRVISSNEGADILLDIEMLNFDDTVISTTSLQLESGAIYAIIKIDDSSLFHNTTLYFEKSGVDLGISTVIELGNVATPQSSDEDSIWYHQYVAFDAVKTNDSVYEQSINISDAIDVLRHIVDLQEITQGSNTYHAADVNNDGNINISDAIDILRHIVDLEAIDTFDLIDSDGNRVTQINANASGEAPIWTIVANGDVDMSGSFADDYVVSSELV